MSDRFKQHQSRLRRQLTQLVRTSAANIDDACAYAWMQLLSHSPDADSTYSWLLTVAIRHAIKLDQDAHRELALELAAEAELEPIDRRSEVRQYEVMLDAAVAIVRANLTERELRILSLHVAGYSSEEISALTRDTLRTVERQLLRARRKLRAAHR